MSATPKILPNERELFSLMAEGNEIAFSDIFFFYIPLLQPHIFGMTRSEEMTQDIIHDVFLKIWVGRAKLKEVENYKAYIFRMATNQTYDWLRKQANEKIALAGTRLRMQESLNTTEEAIDLNQSAAIIDQAIMQLPPQRKLVFKLSREEGLSNEEIAERLNISKYTVKNHLAEALRSIKEYLQKMPGATGTSILSIVLATRILN
jgi:RNA polymerase sigma-70 factor (family 1)